MSKIKVAWICHFTNDEIQSILNIEEPSNEFAQWIPNLIRGFENDNSIELHVISPHKSIKSKHNFVLRNINYHFIPIGIPLIHRHWPRILRFDLWTNFLFYRHKIKRELKIIKPHIINLHGAENAYYSSVVLDIYKKYPILVMIQGFVGKQYNISSFEDKIRVKIEKKILSKLTYFCGDQNASEVLCEYNNRFQFYTLDYPVNEDVITNIEIKKKIFDFVFFGRLTLEKGIVEFFKVLKEIKKNSKVDVSALVIGGGNLTHLSQIAQSYDVFNNITFTGFIKTQREMFERISSSRICLVPTLVDTLPSTIREAMLLKIPIVAYETGAIPTINRFSKNICLVETGDYKKMAELAHELLNSNSLQQEFINNAYEYYQTNYKLKVSYNLFKAAYDNILIKQEYDL